MTEQIINISKMKKTFERLEDRNDNTCACKLLVDAFGTEEEKKTIGAIFDRTRKSGISPDDYRTRYEISSKYFHLIK